MIMFRLQPFDSNDLRFWSDESIMVPQPGNAIHDQPGLIEERETMATRTKRERLASIRSRLEQQRHEARLLQDEMPHIRMKANWSEQVIAPLTSAIEYLELVEARTKKLLRKQGFVRPDQVLGGLL